MAGWDMGIKWEDVWEFPGQFYRGTVQSQGILYNPMGHRGLMGLRGSLMANLDMTGFGQPSVSNSYIPPLGVVVLQVINLNPAIYIYGSLEATVSNITPAKFVSQQ